MKVHQFRNPEAAIINSLNYLAKKGQRIKTKKWQGVDTPQFMLEAINLDFSVQMEESVQAMREHYSPSLPWADLHFEERVGGFPTNPGETYTQWPYWVGNHLDKNEQFTHTYQERLWTPKLNGIRYNFGDLQDVIDLLCHEPDTRQAYIPIWFPEDTGVKHGGRVPCTIGYHVIIRDGVLHIRYQLRSCDARRHFNDDLYLCNRLAYWVRDIIERRLDCEIRLGLMTVNITSFHVFESDIYWLNKKIKDHVWNNH